MHFHSRLALCALAVTSILSTQAVAAERVKLHQSNAANKASQAHRMFAAVDSGDYQAVTFAATPGGDEKGRFQQFHQGIPVYAASVVASRSAMKQLHGLYGEQIVGIEKDLPSLKPKYDLDTAVEQALGHTGVQLSRDEVENLQSQLFIWLDNKDKAHLAWQISYVHLQPGQAPVRPMLFIDAHSGDVLDSWDAMAFASGTGPGGNQRTGRYTFGPNGTFPAFEVTGSGSSCRLDSTNVETWDMNHATSGGSVHSFPCYENTAREVNGGYSALNDAHAFGQVTFNMYRDWYNKAPISQKLRMRVHYDRNYENAFWDGQQMTFGDGNTVFHPLVDLGVVAHEVSHGFTQQNSNLEYQYQSGGLNESFSDIAAAAASYYLTGSFSWQIGDKIKKGSGAMRYMNNPPQDGRSIDHASQYNSSMDVHHSSGVYNKAFYLLSTTSGWNIRKAFDIYVRANQLYWTANATFNSAGQGVYKAAKDLGYCVDDVVASLEGVGISGSGAKDGSGCGGGGSNQAPNANFSYSINGLTVSFSDSSSDDKGISSRSWNFGDNSSSTATNPSHSYASAGRYTVTLKVTDAEGLSDEHQVSISVGSTSPGECTTAAWNATTAYSLGDRVSYKGYNYEAIWWSTGAAPDVYTNVWQKLDKCDGGNGGDNQAPVADFSYSANGLAVDFTSLAQDDKSVASHSWNFGDGNGSSATNPSHNYVAAGNYQVQLTVTDAEGLSHTASKTVNVSGGGNGSCSAQPWDGVTVYLSGDMVSQNGKEYFANWWNQGQSPEVFSGPWDVWTLLGSCQ